MPSQRLNPSSTDASAGSQISSTTNTSGSATITPTTIWSLVRILRRRRRRVGGPSAVRSRTGRGGVGLVIVISLLPSRSGSAREDRLLLLLEALRQSVDVVRVLQEGLERRDHHRRCEVRAGVAVQEL